MTPETPSDGPAALRELSRQIEEIARAHPRWDRMNHVVYLATEHISAIARIMEQDDDDDVF
jgi:hypothetical protein